MPYVEVVEQGIQIDIVATQSFETIIIQSLVPLIEIARTARQDGGCQALQSVHCPSQQPSCIVYADSRSISARGKVQELRAELQQADRKDKGFMKKKTALKKIVANMTMGNDSTSCIGLASVLVSAEVTLPGSVTAVPGCCAVYVDTGSGNQEE